MSKNNFLDFLSCHFGSLHGKGAKSPEGR